MKLHEYAARSVLLLMFLFGTMGQAQNPQGQPPRLDQLQPDQLRELERQFNLLAAVQRGGGGRGAPVLLPPGDSLRAVRINSGAWWTNTSLIERLGLTEDQKAKIQRAYENHRQQIMTSSDLLEKEEAQLAKLLEAEPLDRNAVYSQIDRVSQARAELERANSAMTLEMREALTRAQWLQLQPSQRPRVGPNILGANLISVVEPVYQGVQGVVVLEADISKEGVVESLRVISGPAQLAQAAMDAVKQWRYKPISMNGSPTTVVGNITVNFPFSGGRGTAPTPTQAIGGRRGGGQRQQ